MARRTRREWKKLFRDLGDIQRNATWDIGDAILECREQFGELADQYVAETGLSDSYLYNAERFADIWSPEERDPSLGFALYRDAGADKEIARKLLEAAKRQSWSREQFRAARRELKKKLEGEE